MDIKNIETAELILDLKNSLADIKICKQALSLSPPIETYSGGSVQRRLDINEKIVVKIKKELVERGFAEYSI